jgi:hypothetical protein
MNGIVFIMMPSVLEIEKSHMARILQSGAPPQDYVSPQNPASVNC